MKLVYPQSNIQVMVLAFPYKGHTIVLDEELQNNLQRRVKNPDFNFVHFVKANAHFIDVALQFAEDNLIKIDSILLRSYSCVIKPKEIGLNMIIFEVNWRIPLDNECI